MIKNIKQVANVLLYNNISFSVDFESRILTVKDEKIRNDLFEIACYHAETKKLVLMCSDYINTISVDTLNMYFKENSN
jgi:hypothetical protein